MTKTYFWQLAGRLKPKKTGTFSSKAYVKAKCSRFRTRTLTKTYYKGPMELGTIVAEINTPEKNWRFVPTGSIDDLILKAVCNHIP